MDRPISHSFHGGMRYAGSMMKRPHFTAAGAFLGCAVHPALTQVLFETTLLWGCMIMRVLLGAGLRGATLKGLRPIS